LSAYLDRELPSAACDEIKKHMAGCADCRVILKTLKKTIALCRQIPKQQPSRAALTRVRSAIKRELARTGRSST
jgi:RNA polymerase sigma-70 factor (ECF subfamily)